MRVIAAAIATLAALCGVACAADATSPQQVVFVCEHGNVKSLMAASYFNQLAKPRGRR